MTEGLKWTLNEVPKSDDTFLELMSEENVKKANEFHKSFPQYTVTPLQKLSSLASYLGVKNIFCKDESYRFGLNAFKVGMIFQSAALFDSLSVLENVMFPLDMFSNDT